MKSKFAILPMVTLIGVSMVGCAGGTVQTAYGPMPAYCTGNNAATGAVIGGLVGAGIGAALGGGRGAAIGAASGAAFGGLTGAQADAQCRQLAYRRAAEMAFAAQARAMSSGGPPPSYETMDYVQPSTGQHRTVKVTPLSNQTSSAGGAKCVQVSDSTSSSRMCKSADGTLQES
jgi:hypothetical protein